MCVCVCVGGGGGGGGGWGILEPQELFFVIKFLVSFFRPYHEYFLGLICIHDFFSI